MREEGDILAHLMTLVEIHLSSYHFLKFINFSIFLYSISQVSEIIQRFVSIDFRK